MGRIPTFTRVFEELEDLSRDSLFDFEEEKIIPQDVRTLIIFIDALTWPYDRHPLTKFSSTNLLDIHSERPSKSEIEEAIRTDFEKFPYSKNFVFPYYDHPSVGSRKSINDFTKKLSKDTALVVQAAKRSELAKMRNRCLPSSEELGELVSMLYLREKGYIVQSPPKTYGRKGDSRPGVDDVLAWRSPLLDKLRDHNFTPKNRGCHMSEVACLRWLGKTSGGGKESGIEINNDLILVEVESSRSNGISNSPSKGINQLLRAVEEKLAKGLYISFPLIGQSDEVFEEIGKKCREKGNLEVGGILFSPDGLHVEKSEKFPHGNLESEIEELEKYLKIALLNNFYFDEIIDMMKEFVDTDRKGLEEVKKDFYSNMRNIPIDYILNKLEEVCKKR